LKPVIDSGLADFLGLPVMLVAAVRSVQGKAAIARGMGVRLGADRAHVDFLVSRMQWPDAVLGLEAGAPVALTACDPTNYRTIQIKGRLVAVTDADAGDLMLGKEYRDRIFANLRALGVEDRQIACWLAAEDLVRLRFSPVTVFDQTPGQGAGAALASSAQDIFA
jgi:hypothetical protein